MSDLKYWIALTQVKGIGPAFLEKKKALLDGVNISLADLFDLADDEIKKEFALDDKTVEAISQARAQLGKIETDYQALTDADIEIIPFFDIRYPARLKTTLKGNFPPLLYSYGNTRLFNKRGAAILGDREVSEKGGLISFLAGRELAGHRIVVISGMAQGVDQIAHRSALEHNGDTIAVLPYGMLQLKVPELLKDRIDTQRMLFVSPFYPTTPYSSFNAINRNRIIAALSYAVYIVEAPLEGGVFEAAKSCEHVQVPLFVSEYGEYPRTAAGNKKLIDEHRGTPIRGRMQNDMLVPNLDALIAAVKFAE